MENNLKKLPPLERKPDGSLYRMTPAQRKRANALIRRECCSYDSGNCIVLDDGDTCIFIFWLRVLQQDFVRMDSGAEWLR